MSATSKKSSAIPRIFWYFAAFFAFIATVDAILVTLAVNSQTGMVTDHPYERGLAYNKTIEAANAQQSLGWQMEIKLTPQKLNILWKDKAGKPITTGKVYAVLRRPTQEKLDQQMHLHAKADSWETEVELSAKGLWEVRAYATSEDGREYQFSKRVVVE